MDFLGIFSSALLLFLLLLIMLNIYCIHAYYKLIDKINQIYFVIDSIRKEQQPTKVININPCEDEDENENENEKKEINISSENFKNFYYPTSPSSLIEVSDDEETTYSSYDSDIEETYDSDNCQIKNVHMELDLDNLGDIHVMLLDEIANIEELNVIDVSFNKKIKIKIKIKAIPLLKMKQKKLIKIKN